MKILNSKPSAFTLVELIVIVAIISIISVSSVVGFGYLGDILKAREVTGFIADVVKQEELKVLRGDYEKTTIHFFPLYLVIDQRPEDASLTLQLENLNHIKYENDGNLTLKDENGDVLEIKSVTALNTETLSQSFHNALEAEWSYQLIDGEDYSNIIRFVHFNLQRENLNNPISIITGENSKIVISAPYAKKQLFDSNGRTANSIDIEVEDESHNSKNKITIQ